MTSLEFKRKINKLGFHYYKVGGQLSIRNDRGEDVARIWEHNGQYTVSPEALRECNRAADLVDALHEYAFTPEEEKEEKFYWKIKGLDKFDFVDMIDLDYIYLNEKEGHFCTSTKDEVVSWKTKLTESEYNSFVKRGLIPDIFEREVI